MTEPYFSDDTITLWLGDCREVLAGMPDASVDAVVTDPPYELAFMGRAWDASGIAFDPVVWRECIRVLKPGGHLLAFGGTRTWHRLAVAIEDAGFDIRDAVAGLTGQDAPGLIWAYGQGFPKSLDISKAIDKGRDDRADILNVAAFLAAARDAAGWTNRQIDEAFGFNGMAGHWTARPHLKIAMVPTWEQWLRLKDWLSFSDEMDAEVWRLNGRKGQPGEAWADRPIVGERTTGIGTGRGAVAYIGDSADRSITAAPTETSKRWEGWGTALKPAWEPIVLARKPPTGTVAANVLEHGTGALNITACRIPSAEPIAAHRGQVNSRTALGDHWHDGYKPGDSGRIIQTDGRWPANLVFSHGQGCSEEGPCEAHCPVAELDRQSGIRKDTAHDRGKRHGAVYGGGKGPSGAADVRGTTDEGGASRFFPTFRYEAKAPSSERPKLADGTAHATVKPLSLMRWLVRLVTPPGGVVLDPFAGSGTTGEACVLEGFRAVLVELEQPHAELIKARLSKPLQPALDLFGEVPDGG